MNLRCMYCQTMFGISRENMLIALQAMEAENLSHFDFHCPKCRRANRVERKKLALANPNWQETLKAMDKEAAKAGKAEVAQAKAEKPAPKSKAAPKKAATPAKEKKPVTTSKAASKASAAKKPVARSTEKSKTSTKKKPAATKTASKGK